MLALSQPHPQPQQKPMNLERNTWPLSPKPGKGRMASKKGSVDPLIGFDFKNWKDAIKVFFLAGEPQTLIQAISKRICGISDTSSQAWAARAVNTLCPHSSSSTVLPSAVSISPAPKPTGTKARLGSAPCLRVSECVPGNESQGTEIQPCAGLTA